MRLAHAAFGGGSPKALLALSGRRAATAGKHLATAEAGSRRATTRVHCPQFLSFAFHDMGAVFINTILHHAQKDMRGAVFGLLGRKMQKDSV